MANKMEIRIAGSGGQGVILASIILAEAALLAGKNVAQTQSYGAEARGGMCKAEVVISDEKIGFFKVRRPTFLLALTQQSLEQYTRNLPENCVVMADDSLETPAWMEGKGIIFLPILQTASEKVGRALTANIVAVGAINKILSLSTDEELRQAVAKNIPAGTEKLNLSALEMGEALIPA
ncbi:MAG: 2-oxoacid:acceptor oxidoreductase family protein [Clostridiales bacterium]|nr:2-oxoacid:acceptor oxidoreductase family protein [Clostridiales bacterium]